MDAGILREPEVVSYFPNALWDQEWSEVSFGQLRVVRAGDGMLPEGFKFNVNPLSWGKCDVLAFSIDVALHCLLCL